MSNRLAFQTQLASIMEVLANAAVAEICKLVDDDYAVMSLQMSQCQRENKALKRKLHLLELRMARGYAERRIRESSLNRSSRVQVNASLPEKYRDYSRAPAGDMFPGRDELYGRQLNEDLWREREPSAPDVAIDRPVPKENETVAVDAGMTGPEAVLVKAETTEEGHKQQELFIREDGVAEAVSEGGETGYGAAQLEKADGHHSRTRRQALEVSGSEKVLKSEPQFENAERLSQEPLGQESEAGFGVSGECGPLGELFVQGCDNADPQHPACSYMMTGSTTESQSEHPPQKSEIIEVESAEEGDEPSVWDSSDLPGRHHTLQRYGNDGTVEHFNNVSLPTSSQSQLTGDFPAVASTSSVVQGMENWQHAKAISLYQPRTGWPRNERVPHEKLFSCKYCGKAFNRPKKVEIHQRIHTGEKPFRCMTCGKFFAEAGNLKKHQKVHTGERPYSCTHCGKTFAWIRNLKTHQQKYHPDVLIAEELLSLGALQKTEDEEPDVLFIKEEHTEQERRDSQTHGGMSVQDGFVESSTDICGSRVSSSPAQITIALGAEESEELDSSLMKEPPAEQEKKTNQSAGVQITIQNVVGAQTSASLHSRDPVLPHRGGPAAAAAQIGVKVWDLPSTESQLQGGGESISNPLSSQSTQRRKMPMSVDVLGANNTLYERPAEVEALFTRWTANNSSPSQPSCSYVVDEDQDQDCVLVQPGALSVRGIQEGMDGVSSNRLQDTRGPLGVEAEWTSAAISQQTQQLSHYSRTEGVRLEASNRANVSQSIPKVTMNSQMLTNFTQPGFTLAGIQFPKRMEKGKRKSYICKYCGKAFTGLSNVEAHQRVHTGEKPFKCETCGKLFAEAGNLKKHQRVHTGEKPFTCTRCGKRFAWICNLRTHQQSASCGGV
ncbi:uncharacterized protein [Salminus brasiliensis]|uniref:uncharacterized protein n=1 Tax=Salminus brasiliensis TaxID=930266 RepID=UPI003B82E0A2